MGAMPAKLIIHALMKAAMTFPVERGWDGMESIKEQYADKSQQNDNDLSPTMRGGGLRSALANRQYTQVRVFAAS